MIRVFDQSRKPVAGARIWVRSGAARLHDLTVVTNKDGQSFLSLPIGRKLEIVCSAASYSLRTIDMEIEEDSSEIIVVLQSD